MKVVSVALLATMVVLAAGCRRVDERKVYRIARDYVEQQVGEGVEVSPMGKTLFAVGKNAARVDVDYRRSGADPVEGYMTVWCKRVRMRWEFERAADSRSSGAVSQ
jgi:hypothetical protein